VAAVFCDVTEENMSKKAIGDVREVFCNIDLLVNCAGIAPTGPLIGLSLKH
jgi:NADP-dependent 3-hydroxy acid dehydrogenase YdfG